MVKTLALSICVLALATAAAQPPQPTPSAENKNLARFVGTWKMDGKMNPSPMGPGGTFTGTETCRLFEGGFHIVCDSTGSGALGDMKGHALMTWDRNAKTYRYFSVSNMADATSATGTFANNTWTFTGGVEMSGKKLRSRFVIVETTPTQHTMKWEMSEDGKTWTTVMEGKSVKQ